MSPLQFNGQFNLRPMKFGEVTISKAHGGILAHSLRTSSGKVKKGRILSEQDIANLVSAGYTTLTIARLETDDASENEAAATDGGEASE